MANFLKSTGSQDHLDLLLATSEIGIWELDVATGKAERNLRHDQIFGHELPLPDWSADIFLSYVFDADRERVAQALSTSVQDGSPWSFDARIRRADGVDRWITARGIPKTDETGKMTKLIGYVIDITDTKQTEERLELLTRELNHRVSNTFTILNSMIRQAKTRARTVDEFAATLVDRLTALSRSNRVLTAHQSARSSLSGLLDMTLAPFTEWQSRITIEGPTDVWFSPEASEALSLIAHELLTNAVKYGALSNADGRITITVSGADSREIAITWREQDGPPIAPVRTSGIGTSILTHAMRDQGRVTLDFAPDGLVCDIVVFDSFRQTAPDRVAPASVAPFPHDEKSDARLADRKIMVVEDDPIIGLDIADILEMHGAVVIGPFTTRTAALQALEEPPDAALLDINLGRETSADVAIRLTELDVPHMVLSGQIDSSALGAAFSQATVMQKPFRESDLIAALSDLWPASN